MPQEFYTLWYFNFIMIYIIYKISVPLKITLVSLNIGLSNAFSRSVIEFYFFKKQKTNLNFVLYIIMKSSRLVKDKK